MILFFIGVIEMVIISCWTKYVTEAKVIWSGAVTVINVFIWYYVLEQIIANINNWALVLLYAVGCALGTMMTTYYFSRKENVGKQGTVSSQNI